MTRVRVTEHQIKIMQAFTKGHAIEYRKISKEEWEDCPVPLWDWISYEYRIKSLTPDTIDWAQVRDKYQYMARDSSGDAYLYLYEPELVNNCYWFCEDDNPVKADAFASYKKGTVSWDNSLVERP